MKCKWIQEKDYITTNWSGGTTSQILIWPPDSVFADRSFDWRISRATVDAGESSFTKMNGFHRELYLLSGGTTLYYQDQKKVMRPGSTICFSGDWDIRSVGGGTDLNLIMNENTEGYLEEKQLKTGQLMRMPQSSEAEYCLFYVVQGSIQIRDVQASAGESLFCIPEEDGGQLEAFRDSKVICFYIGRRKQS